MPFPGSHTCILCHYKFAIIHHHCRILATYPYFCPTCLCLKNILIKHNVSNCPVCIEYRENKKTIGKCNAKIIKCLRAMQAIQFCVICQVARQHVYKNYRFFCSFSQFCTKCAIIVKSIKTIRNCVARSFYFAPRSFAAKKYYTFHQSSTCCYCIMYGVKK